MSGTEMTTEEMRAELERLRAENERLASAVQHSNYARHVVGEWPGDDAPDTERMAWVLRDAVMRSGKTQVQLSKELGHNQSYLSVWGNTLRRGSYPNLGHLLDIERVLGMEPGELLVKAKVIGPIGLLATNGDHEVTP